MWFSLSQSVIKPLKPNYFLKRLKSLIKHEDDSLTGVSGRWNKSEFISFPSVKIKSKTSDLKKVTDDIDGFIDNQNINIFLYSAILL